MALNLNAVSTANINHGSAAILDDIPAGTIAVWAYPQLVGSGAHTMCRKNQHALIVFGASIQYFINRATSFLDIRVETADIAVFGVNKWLYIAVVWNVNGSESDQRMFVGDATTPAAEFPYVAQTPGAGAITSNADTDLIVGNNAGLTNSADYHIGTFQMWNRVLSPEELLHNQWLPRISSGLVLFSRYGENGTSTQFDLSGNGNSGTVGGATVSTLDPPIRRVSLQRVVRGAGAAAGNTIGQNLLDTLTFSDTLDIDTETGYLISLTGDAFSDEIQFNIIEDAGGASIVNVTLQESITLTESFGRDPYLERIMVN